MKRKNPRMISLTYSDIGLYHLFMLLFQHENGL